MIRKTLILIVILIILSSGFVFAEPPQEDLNSLSSAIRNNPAEFSSSGRASLIGLGGDFLNITRYILITALLVKLAILLTEFSHAGDNPQVKASIKSKSIWLSLGVICAVNFWSIFKFTSNILSNLRF